MSLYKMPIEPAIYGQAALQVNQIARLPVSEGSFEEGFFYGRNPVGAGPQLVYREAYTVVAQALIHAKLMRQGGFHPKLPVTAPVIHFPYLAQGLYDSCKHGANFGETARKKRIAFFSSPRFMEFKKIYLALQPLL
jgi:hypothetical protein